MRFVAASGFSALLLGSISSPADACINAVQMTQDEATYRIAAVHAAMRLEQYWFADLMIPEGKFGRIGYIEITDRPHRDDDKLDLTLLDVQQVIEMRWGEPDEDDAADLETYFRRRLEDGKSPRLVAWLAEASALSGDADNAVALLRDLEQHDLMPDAHAYAMLAEHTSGAEQLRAAAQCRVRALVKTICPVVPGTQTV